MRRPPHLWSDKRHERSYLNQVLARSEVESNYRPARRLFARARHRHYLANPAMLLRQGEGGVPVYDALVLDWVEPGCANVCGFNGTPAGVVARSNSEAVQALAADQGK